MMSRLFHPGPLFALSIISFCFICSIITILSWLPPGNLQNFINTAIFHFWVLNILKNFFKSAFIGPGHLQFQWEPERKGDKELLQYCECCEGYKAPRAHHCKTCKRCIMKMDHHCPWINNCVGHYNHKSFTLFLIYVVFGCSHAAIMMILCILDHLVWRNGFMMLKVYEDAIIKMQHSVLILLFFGTGLSIGVTIAVGFLLYYQIRSIIKNETGIETWILEKALSRQRHARDVFVYPYDLGIKENIKQVMVWSADYVGDGITWPVRKGCDQYTLTVEQLQQKDLKRDRTIPYTVIKEYSGTWCPFKLGCRVLYDCPWSDEPRIKVEVGDTLFVSRHRNHWVYGERAFQSEDSKPIFALGDTRRLKGWVPTTCLKEIEEEETDTEDVKKNR